MNAKKKTRSKKLKRDLYAEITDSMVEALEAGTCPWRKTWKGTGSAFPSNASTGKDYRGINVVMLWVAAMRRGYSCARWATFKQAKALAVATAKRAGRKLEERGRMWWDLDADAPFLDGVRKGEKGTTIVFWKAIERENAKGEDDKFWMMRVYSVFNLEQCDGIATGEADESRPEVELDAGAQAVADAYLETEGIDLLAGNPAYSPRQDAVFMPPADSFEGAAEYHGTLFHELTHSTGHSSRLDRDMSTVYGNHAYSKEELVAEMGSAFLCALTGTATDESRSNSAAYLAHWVKALKGDPKLVVGAAQQAQKAVDRVRAASEVGAKPAAEAA